MDSRFSQASVTSESCGVLARAAVSASEEEERKSEKWSASET